MAYYIIYFDADDIVIDVCKYSENEREEYLKDLAKAQEAMRRIQYGYF